MNFTVSVIRKPFTGTVAHNVLEHYAGGLNIDGTRIGTNDTIEQTGELEDLGRGTCHPGYDRPGATMFRTGKPVERSGPSNQLGRFPANFLLNEKAAVMLDEMSGESKGRAKVTRGGKRRMDYGMGRQESVFCHNDSGGASRFFHRVSE